MKNYIVINGKKAELTKEQLKKLGIKSERNNPFDRVEEREDYFVTRDNGTVSRVIETFHDTDTWYYDNAAYFNDKEFSEQMSLKWLLNRKLEKYAWDNGAEDVEWDDKNGHYLIYYNFLDKSFNINVFSLWKWSGVIYFSDREVAEEAIKDVIEPFMKEHPEFRW